MPGRAVWACYDLPRRGMRRLRFAWLRCQVLPCDLLQAVVGHEAAHAVLHAAGRADFADEAVTNRVAARWGFAIAELYEFLGEQLPEGG